MKIATVAQMRAMDRRAIDDYRIPESILMENAGLAAYRVLRDRFPVAGQKILVLCGGGNNGGDGLVVARKILSDGGNPQVLLLGDPSRYKGAAALNWEMVRHLGIATLQDASAAPLDKLLGDCGLVVDAILGTGLSKPVRGGYADVIDRLNDSGRPVLSLDIPSGIHGDTGQVLGTAVRAAATVTFGLPKIGNLLYPGYHYGGRLFATHIGFPPALTRDEGLTIALNRPPAMPERPAWGHKGTFGDALFICGAAGYYGAPFLAAMAHLKAGGGYARLAAPAAIVPTLAALGPELVFLPQAATDRGSLALRNHHGLLEASRDRDMVVIGPGVSLDDETVHLVRRLVPAVAAPLLIDGDGITAVSPAAEETLARRTSGTVLTPHPGEMARLTGLSVAAIQDDPVGLLQQTAARLNAIVVLKGAHSLIGLPDQRVLINMTGCDAMATAGAGDVLTGIIAAMVGAGLPLEAAVCKGVALHGAAGEIAAEALGADGVTARDVLAHLPEAVRRDRRRRVDPSQETAPIALV
jgi:NAD(P)H-hydrate epimerase